MCLPAMNLIKTISHMFCLDFSQSDGMVMDNYGILYYGLLKNHAVAKWDSYRPFALENQQIIAKDDAHIQWTDGEALIKD